MLLLFNLRNVGHFSVYCHNLTLWALNRGLKVVSCGLDAQETGYFARFHARPEVRFLDLRERLGLGSEPLRDADVVEHLCGAGGMARQIEVLRGVQRELAPQATVLLNADELFFNFPLERGEELFAAPTYAVLTFGHRDRYTGHDEKYAWRLRRVLHDRSVFARLLTIDEYHAACEDPAQSFLVHLPDPYREMDEAGAQDGEGRPEHPDAVALRRFLAADARPVLPIAGKFDERKNNLWLLEEVAARLDLRCAVIGERVASPTLDERIDGLLDGLERQGRLFRRFGFVPHALFDILFASPKVPCAAFPYLAHYGSSGIHLMAAEHAKPCLVPDVGLMARRTREAGLGLLFRHGDREDFRRQFARLMAGEGVNAAGNFVVFRAAFGRESLFAALDYAFGLRAAPPPLPAWTRPGRGGAAAGHVGLLDEALDLAHCGEIAAGLTRLDQALALAPDHAALLLKRLALLLRTGDEAACLAAWQHVLDVGGGAAEVEFLVRRLSEYLRDLPAGAGVYDEAMLMRLLPRMAGRPDDLRDVGGVLAARGAYDEAEAAFRRALVIAPDRDDIRLNLSDVLRYASRLVESRTVLDELACRSPNAPGLWCKRGQVLAAEGRTDEARAALEREIVAGGPFAELAASWLTRLA